MKRFVVSGLWDALLNILLMGALQGYVQKFWPALGLFSLVDALMLLLLFATLAVKQARSRRGAPAKPGQDEKSTFVSRFYWRGALVQFLVGMVLSTPFLLVFDYTF